jgi:homopolymeric O-antigen transport system permease protein
VLSVVDAVVEAGGRRSLHSGLEELWAFRGTTLAFAERDLRVKYKQTALGVLWAVVQPVAFMGIFALAFGRFANVSGGGVPYAAFALSAVVPWIFIQTAVTFAAGSLVADASLIRKVYFPREVAVLGTVLAALVDLVIGLVVFAIAGPALGATVSLTWLLVPLLVLPLFALAAGVGLLLAALTVYYRDFRYALPFLLQLWLFASPVAYPLSSVPSGGRWVYLALNPAAGLLDSISRALTMGALPNAGYLAVSLAGIALLAAGGYGLFKRLEPNFGDIV